MTEILIEVKQAREKQLLIENYSKMTQRELQLLLATAEIHRNRPKKPTKPGQNPPDLEVDQEEMTPEED